MDFNSLSFILFFCLVFVGYYVVPNKYKWAILLIASYFFYFIYQPKYVLLLFFTTCVTYFCALKIEKEKSNIKKKRTLITTLVINLLLLFIFKYMNFINVSINRVMEMLNINYSIPAFSLLMPLGISFYTFKIISYIVDVYKGKIKAERHLGIFAVFVSFFPQLVAGPIDRGTNLLPQLNDDKNFNYELAKSGVYDIVWGSFKKFVIADRLAVITVAIFSSVSNYRGITLLIATLAFTIQIYCDFSGYSSIAIGLGKVLGYRFINNFDKPYFSKSIKEFWKKWHISLSSWFRDYVYIPLGGNRVSKGRNYFNLFVTFLVSGLWHGASWNFAIWGSIHGIYLIISSVLQSFKRKVVDVLKLNKVPVLHSTIQMIITFALVSFAWIFFKVTSFNDALIVIKSIAIDIINVLNPRVLIDSIMQLPVNKSSLLIIIISVIILIVIEAIQCKISISQYISKKNIVFRYLIYIFACVFILFFASTTQAEFIYLQF